MNPEFRHLEQPIENGDSAERERILKDRLAEIQLHYLDAKAKKEGDAARARFSDIIERDSFLLNGVRSAHAALERKGVRGLPGSGTTFEEDAERLRKDIDALHEGGGEGWRQKVIDRINGEMERAKPLLEQEAPIEKSRAGLFNYNVKEGLEGLERYGIGPEDEVLEVHVEEAYKQKDASFGPEGIKASFAELAERIVDSFPQAKAVVGRSWLLDHPVGRRLGFKTVEEHANDLRGPSTWFQFIDKDGQIDRQKLEKMLAAGEPPYKEKFGIIPVEDFLRRYLPPERRGKEIVLKEVSPEWAARHQRQMEAGKRFKDEWPSVAAGGVRAWIERHGEINDLLTRIGRKEEYAALLEAMKERGVEWKEMRDKEPARFGPIDAAVNAEVDKDKYLEKKIVI